MSLEVTDQNAGLTQKDHELEPIIIDDRNITVRRKRVEPEVEDPYSSKLDLLNRTEKRLNIRINEVDELLLTSNEVEILQKRMADVFETRRHFEHLLGEVLASAPTAEQERMGDKKDHYKMLVSNLMSNTRQTLDRLRQECSSRRSTASRSSASSSALSALTKQRHKINEEMAALRSELTFIKEAHNAEVTKLRSEHEVEIVNLNKRIASHSARASACLEAAMIENPYGIHESDLNFSSIPRGSGTGNVREWVNNADGQKRGLETNEATRTEQRAREQPTNVITDEMEPSSRLSASGGNLCWELVVTRMVIGFLVIPRIV
ncbi:uncharacterized protein LOC113475454 [Ciona intestinalis]